MDSTDDEWIELIRSGSRRSVDKALVHIWKKYFSKVKSFVVKNNGSRADAEDIFQESILVLYDNILAGKIIVDASIGPYLYAICRNKWYTIAKRKEKIKKTEITYDEDLSYVEIDNDVVSQVLNVLSKKCREVLHEFYFNKKSMHEIMAQFELGSEQTAKNKKYLCLKKLVEVIKERNLTIESFIK